MACKADCWGPTFWRLLHVLTCVGSAEAVQETVKFFQSCLPCPDCLQHFREVTGDYPPPASPDLTALKQWAFDVHNLVNKRLKRPAFSSNDFRFAYDCVRPGSLPQLWRKFLEACVKTLEGECLRAAYELYNAYSGQVLEPAEEQLRATGQRRNKSSALIPGRLRRRLY
jgi:hypothetical protein